MQENGCGRGQEHAAALALHPTAIRMPPSCTRLAR